MISEIHNNKITSIKIKAQSNIKQFTRVEYMRATVIHITILYGKVGIFTFHIYEKNKKYNIIRKKMSCHRVLGKISIKNIHTQHNYNNKHEY